MNEALKNFLAGAGSVVDIAPCEDFSRFVSEYSPEQRMRDHWERTGTYLRNALDHYSDEQQAKEKQS